MRTRTSGFTLAEVMVAALLTAFTFLFLITVFPATRKALRLSENRSRAALLGKSLLNQARTADFATLAPTSGSYTFVGKGDNKDFAQPINYQLQVRNEGVDRKWLWVTLTWTESTGSKLLVVETMRTRR